MRINYGNTIGFELLTIHPDGTVNIVDNTESGYTPPGGVTAQPFSSQLGEWKCVGKNKFHIRTGNYDFQVSGNPAPSKLSFNDILLTFTKDGENLEGKYRFAHYKLGTYPKDPGAQPLPNESYGPYNISGRRFCFF
ncbi:unnamed protein product [Rotaria sordida]|uniref:Uncharacterized protein n=1 Tax=Rotaria sordida TaxID=392033 RepID=A0A819E356_9BILA|nr:unnamed protein product [Rotaria sordida]